MKIYQVKTKTKYYQWKEENEWFFNTLEEAKEFYNEQLQDLINDTIENYELDREEYEDTIDYDFDYDSMQSARDYDGDWKILLIECYVEEQK